MQISWSCNRVGIPVQIETSLSEMSKSERITCLFFSSLMVDLLLSKLLFEISHVEHNLSGSVRWACVIRLEHASSGSVRWPRGSSIIFVCGDESPTSSVEHFCTSPSSDPNEQSSSSDDVGTSGVQSSLNLLAAWEEFGDELVELFVEKDSSPGIRLVGTADSFNRAWP